MLVDTSLWINHLRYRDPLLVSRLRDSVVWTHPFVIGEIACGKLRKRAHVLGLLAALPAAPLAGQDDVLALVESRRLMGRGLGWIDMHLLAAAKLASLPLWTSDRRLAAAARELDLSDSR